MHVKQIESSKYRNVKRITRIFQDARIKSLIFLCRVVNVTRLKIYIVLDVFFGQIFKVLRTLKSFKNFYFSLNKNEIELRCKNYSRITIEGA